MNLVITYEVHTHPVAEAVACKLSGIGGVPPAEQALMIRRAARVAAEMYDAAKAELDEYKAAFDACEAKRRALQAFVLPFATCPCCHDTATCDEECTFAADDPEGEELMGLARQALSV